MYCTAVGKALLSHYTDEIIKEVWDNSEIKQLTPHTLTEFEPFYGGNSPRPFKWICG